MSNEQGYTYNPLDRQTFEAIAFNAVGRASEINNVSAYSLAHSTGNSGWSIGLMQTDFGARPHEVPGLLKAYQSWASADKHYSTQQLASLEHRLQTKGQSGNALSASERANLNEFFHSDAGRSFVNDLDHKQVERKWSHVGEPLSHIKWLSDLSQSNPQEAAQIVAMTGKLFNQNETRGGRMIEYLRDHEVTATQAKDWIGHQGIDGLSQSARSAITTGRDRALIGVQLMNTLETSDNALGKMYRETVHGQNNATLSLNYNADPSVQLFDKMFRDPIHGQQLLDSAEQHNPHRVITLPGTNETAKVHYQNGDITVRSPGSTTEYSLSAEGWKHNGVLLHQTTQTTAPPLSANVQAIQDRISGDFTPELAKLGVQPRHAEAMIAATTLATVENKITAPDISRTHINTDANRLLVIADGSRFASVDAIAASKVNPQEALMSAHQLDETHQQAQKTQQQNLALQTPTPEVTHSGPHR